jgi:membrane-bound lytic murein transglycosylase D
MYGLRIDNYVDERRDPYKSTVAAARYFKDLYNIFKDWHLVMAAYNAGPGTVSRAIKRSGGITNFWKLSPYLPRATAGYVPAFIGCAYAMQYATEHNMYPITPVFPYSQDTIQLVNQRVTLDQIAAATGADLGILRKLNPELKTTVVPFSSRPYVLRVPSAVVWKAHELGYRFGGQPESGEPNLAVNQSQPISFAGAQPETPRPEVSSGLIPTARAATPRPAVPAVPYGTKLVWHEVSAGETVSRIAVYYQVTEQQIRQWNGLTAVHLQVGQKLKVFCPANLDVAKAVRRPGQEVPSAPAASQNAPAQARVHRVRYGDTLWTIAQQYKGISLEDLMKLNGLNKNSILHVGQVIRIPG